MKFLWYRNTDVYKTIMNSRTRARLMADVGSVVRNNKFSRTFKESIRELVGVIRHSSLPQKIIAGGALLYLVAPLDIIPDVIPVMGFADDMFVIGTLILKLRGTRK